MSAFEVDKAHIDVMVSAALQRVHGDTLCWYHDPAGDLPHTRPGQALPDHAYDGYLAELQRRRRQVTHENAETWGATLVAENRRSVDWRYDEDELEEPYTFTEYAGHFDPVKMLAAIACYEYQACEHPGWKTSEARDFCEALRQRTIHQLPGYGSFHGHVTDAAQVTTGQAMRVAGRLTGITSGGAA
jgi:hypothetical protein